MIVCDECKDVSKKAFEVAIIVEKQDESKQRKPKPREVVRIPVALCEGCITTVCKSLGKMKAYGKLSRWNEEPQGGSDVGTQP